MGERGTALMTKASRQFDEMAALFGTLDEADLRMPCLKDNAGYTVGAVAARAAEISRYLGWFLAATGYAPRSPAMENGHDHGRGHAVPEAQPRPSDLLDRLAGGKDLIGLLADLTNEQLDSVPPAGSSRFSDGRRTLERVIDAFIAHQAGLLVALKRGVAGAGMGDNLTPDTTQASAHDSQEHVHAHAEHEHIEHDHDRGAVAHSRHRPDLHHIGHVRGHGRPRGFTGKKRARVLATGGGVLATIHVLGGGALIHVALPILVGAVLWRGMGGIVVGLFVIGMVLYVGVRLKLAKSGKEST